MVPPLREYALEEMLKSNISSIKAESLHQSGGGGGEQATLRTILNYLHTYCGNSNLSKSMNSSTFERSATWKQHAKQTADQCTQTEQAVQPDESQPEIV